MRAQYSHEIAESFWLWLDHTVLSEDSFKNETSALHEVKGKINGWNYYSANAGQFVADASITGAVIPTGARINGVDTPASNDLVIDYLNGGVYYKGEVDVEMDYSRKDFNIYASNQHYSQLFLERLGKGEFVDKKGSSPFNYTAPCILISFNPESNKPFAFGGIHKTEVEYEVVAITDNYYHITGLSSVLNSKTDECFTRLNFGQDSPYDIYGGLKNSYNYEDLLNVRSENNRPILIKKIISYPISSISGNDNFNNYFISLTRFRLEDIRS